MTTRWRVEALIVVAIESDTKPDLSVFPMPQTVVDARLIRVDRIVPIDQELPPL